MNTVKLPYNISALTQAYALERLTELGRVAIAVETILSRLTTSALSAAPADLRPVLS
jgi:hypothetical protein